jgi:putative serine protease PepD
LLLGAGVLGGFIVHETQGTTASASACAVTSVAEQVLPSVVTINASGSGGSGVGSGEIIRADGYILTNNHVIVPAVGGGTLQVRFSDGKSASATIVGRDPLTDLAVIKAAGEANLPVIAMGTATTLQVGQPVVALGAPLGLSSTVTSGIVSALDRTISVPGGSGQSALLIEAVQTDAAINPGNSGGALVDCAGRLVGVPSAGAQVPASSSEPSGSIGLGFAIPVDLAQTVSSEIIATGKVTRSFIGLEASPVGGPSAGQTGPSQGLLVTGVVSGGPADSAGLRMGDIITSINGRAATNTDALVALLLSSRPGDRVTIRYERSGAAATATVTLGQQP